MRKIRIKQLPKAQAGMNFTAPGANSSHQGNMFTPNSFGPYGYGTDPDISVSQTLKPVKRGYANLEAEKGETVVTDLNKTGIPEFYKIGGKLHSAGGTPLNLPQDSFIFSKDKSMKIKDPMILAQFGKNVKVNNKGFVPADLSKKYNLNNYHKILADPHSDKLQIETAEMMIQNYNDKLGALSLVQESLKGFPDGMPGIAMGYLEKSGLNPQEFVQPQEPTQAVPNGTMRYGGAPNATAIKKIEPKSSAAYPNMRSLYPSYQKGGSTKLPEGAAVRFNPSTNKYEVLGPNGNVIGNVNVPTQQGPTTQGGDPSTSKKSTKSQNIPNDAVKWDQGANGYDESQIQPGDYVKKSDGKWYQVNGYKAQPYTGEFSDNRLSGEFGDLQEAYGRLEERLQNPKVKEGLINAYRKNMADAKPNNRTGLSPEDLEAARNLSDDEIVSNLLEMEKQVMSVNANVGNMEGVDPKDHWDKDRSNYENQISNLGFQPLDKSHQAAFQGAYVSLQQMADNPEYKELLEDFDVTQVGIGDEAGGGTGKATISDIDGWVGNTTIGQAALYKPVKKDLDMAEAEWTEEAQDIPDAIKHLPPPAAEEPAPWWLQDIVATAGSAGDFFRVNKHSPWQATPGVKLANPTFMDPTRQLAANAELANISTQGAAAFAGPQAFNARAAQIQGKAAQNVANTLSGVHNTNVGIANQFEQFNTQLLNNASDRKAHLATQLYDKNTIANQQFENEKNMARQNLRQNFINGVTNRAQAQTLNQLYDQYSIDPTSGGFMNFTQGRKITPKESKPSGVMDKAANYKRMNPGWDDSAYIQAAKADAGVPSGNPGAGFGIDPAMFAYPGGMPQGYYGG